MQAKKVAKKRVKMQETPVLKKINIATIKSKLKQPKIILGLIVVVLVVAAFFLKGLFVAAMVNGEPISRISIINELEKQGGKQALSASINQALILQEERKKKVEVSQDELNAAVKEIEDNLKAQGQSLDSALEMQLMTREDLLAQLKIRNLVEKLLADKIKVTDKEIADYIEENKESIPAEMTEDEIKKSAKEQLKQEKLSNASQAWLEELTKNAKINHFVSY